MPIVPSTVPSTGHSGGPAEIAPAPPAAASEAAAGGATFGQILHAAQGQGPAASASVPMEHPAAVPVPPALPVPRDPLPASPEQLIQRAKAPGHQKNERPSKKTASNQAGAHSNDSTIPVSFAPIPVTAPPPAMAADQAPSLPNATGAPRASGGEISPRTSEPAAGQTRNQPLLPADTTMVPDPAGTQSPPALHASPPLQPSISGPANTLPAGLGAQPAARAMPPPLHGLTGTSFTAAASRTDPKAAPRTDAAGPSASSNGPVAAVPLMAEPQPLTPMIPAAAVPAGTPAHQALPAAQVAPALATLAKAPDGTQQMTVRLNPDQLGMVQIRLDRAPSGATHIQILADRPETLQALQRDQPALHKTLDDAGIPGAGRTMVFHDTPRAETPAASPGGSSQGGATHNPAGRSWSNGQGGASGGAQADDRGGPRRGGYPARGTGLEANTRTTPGVTGTNAPSTTIYRIGLNITA